MRRLALSTRFVGGLATLSTAILIAGPPTVVEAGSKPEENLLVNGSFEDVDDWVIEEAVLWWWEPEPVNDGYLTWGTAVVPGWRAEFPGGDNPALALELNDYFGGTNAPDGRFVANLDGADANCGVFDPWDCPEDHDRLDTLTTISQVINTPVRRPVIELSYMWAPSHGTNGAATVHFDGQHIADLNVDTWDEVYRYNEIGYDAIGFLPFIDDGYFPWFNQETHYVLASGRSAEIVFQGFAGGDFGDGVVLDDVRAIAPKKVPICHVRGDESRNRRIANGRAVLAHLNHGDSLGPCA